MLKKQNEVQRQTKPAENLSHYSLSLVASLSRVPQCQHDFEKVWDDESVTESWPVNMNLLWCQDSLKATNNNNAFLLCPKNIN